MGDLCNFAKFVCKIRAVRILQTWEEKIVDGGEDFVRYS